MRNARASSGVLLVFSWDGINVIFFDSKIASMPCQENTRRTPEDALALL
jgi:hypothetical protein